MCLKEGRQKLILVIFAAFFVRSDLLETVINIYTANMVLCFCFSFHVLELDGDLEGWSCFKKSFFDIFLTFDQKKIQKFLNKGMSNLTVIYHQPWQKNMSVESRQIWIFLIFQQENGFCDITKWSKFFSEFLKADKFQVVVRQNQINVVPDLKPPKKSPLFYYVSFSATVSLTKSKITCFMLIFGLYFFGMLYSAQSFTSNNTQFD